MLELKEKIKAEIHADDQRKLEHTFHGSIQLHKGQKLFEYNLETQVLKETIMQVEVKSSLTGKLFKKSRVNTKRNTMYIAAINENNAARKLLKQLQQFNAKNR